MEVVCDHCGAKLKIPDEKVPKDRKLALTCPKCKKKIVVDTRRESARPAGEERPKEAAPPPPPPEDLRDDAADIGFYEEGVSLALVLGRDPGEADSLREAVEELGYKCVTAENTRRAVSTIRLHHFDLILLSDGFDGVEAGKSPVLQFMNHLSMSVRRRIFLALVGDEFKTMDNMAAFAMSVNLVISRDDADRCTPILKRAIADNERFYKVMKDMLLEVGRA